MGRPIHAVAVGLLAVAATGVVAEAAESRWPHLTAQGFGLVVAGEKKLHHAP